MLLKHLAVESDGTSLYIPEFLKDDVSRASVLEVSAACKYINLETPHERPGSFHFGVFPNVYPQSPEPVFMEGVAYGDYSSSPSSRWGWLVCPYAPTTALEVLMTIDEGPDFSQADLVLVILTFAENQGQIVIFPMLWWLPVSAGRVLTGKIEGRTDNHVPITSLPGYTQDQEIITQASAELEQLIYIPLFTLCCLNAPKRKTVQRTIRRRNRKRGQGLEEMYEELKIGDLKEHLHEVGNVQDNRLSHALTVCRNSFGAP